MVQRKFALTFFARRGEPCEDLHVVGVIRPASREAASDVRIAAVEDISPVSGAMHPPDARCVHGRVAGGDVFADEGESAFRVEDPYPIFGVAALGIDVGEESLGSHVLRRQARGFGEDAARQ